MSRLVKVCFDYIQVGSNQPTETMIKPKISVFFDTNSYRQIVLDKSESEIRKLFIDIKIAEQKNNIEPMSTQTVNLELMANLVEEENGINYRNCLESLRFLTNHCYDLKKKEIRVSASPYFQISGMMFGALPIDFDKHSKKFTNFLNCFIEYDGKPKIPEGFYEFVKNNLTKNEQNFSNNIIDLIQTAKIGIEKIYPKINSKLQKKKLIEYFRSENYAQNLSEKILNIVSKQLEIDIDKEELKKRAYFLKTQLPLSVGFFQWILSTIIENDIDMTSKKSKAKRWNWLWDYQISFLVSQSKINDGTIILVTSDIEMTKILHEYNLKEKVMDVKQYLSFLNINGTR